ncbi:MAG: hypothetical protein ACKO6R_04380, partial [Burkholderiaceae bacterium]
TAIGKRNFARWRGAYLAEQRAARSAERGDMAEAHLITASKTAHVQAESDRQVRALSAAIEFATNQKSAVAKLANELYSKSNLLTSAPAGVESLLNSAQSAKQAATDTAYTLASASTTTKAGMTNTTPNLVSALLS